MGRGVENHLIPSLQNPGDMLADCVKNKLILLFSLAS